MSTALSVFPVITNSWVIPGSDVFLDGNDGQEFSQIVLLDDTHCFVWWDVFVEIGGNQRPNLYGVVVDVTIPTAPVFGPVRNLWVPPFDSGFFPENPFSAASVPGTNTIVVGNTQIANNLVGRSQAITLTWDSVSLDITTTGTIFTLSPTTGPYADSSLEQPILVPISASRMFVFLTMVSSDRAMWWGLYSVASGTLTLLTSDTITIDSPDSGGNVVFDGFAISNTTVVVQLADSTGSAALGFLRNADDSVTVGSELLGVHTAFHGYGMGPADLNGNIYSMTELGQIFKIQSVTSPALTKTQIGSFTPSLDYQFPVLVGDDLLLFASESSAGLECVDFGDVPTSSAPGGSSVIAYDGQTGIASRPFVYLGNRLVNTAIKKDNAITLYLFELVAPLNGTASIAFSPIELSPATFPPKSVEVGTESGWCITTVHDFNPNPFFFGNLGGTPGSQLTRTSRSEKRSSRVITQTSQTANAPLPPVAGLDNNNFFSVSNGIPSGHSMVFSFDDRYMYLANQFAVTLAQVFEPSFIFKIDTRTGNVVDHKDAQGSGADLCTDDSGNIYFVSPGPGVGQNFFGSAVGRWAASGEFDVSWSSTNFLTTTSFTSGDEVINYQSLYTNFRKITYGRDGFLYVIATLNNSYFDTDPGDDVILQFNVQDGSYKVLPFTATQSLTNDKYDAIAVDSEGTIWVTMLVIGDGFGPSDSFTDSLFIHEAPYDLQTNYPTNQNSEVGVDGNPNDGNSVVRHLRPGSDLVGFTLNDGQFATSTGNWEGLGGLERFATDYSISKATVSPSAGVGVMAMQLLRNPGEATFDAFLDGSVAPYVVLDPTQPVTFSVDLRADANNATPAAAVITVSSLGFGHYEWEAFSNGGATIPIASDHWTTLTVSVPAPLYPIEQDHPALPFQHVIFGIEIDGVSVGDICYVSNVQTNCVRPGGAIKDIAVQEWINPAASELRFPPPLTNLAGIMVDDKNGLILPMTYVPISYINPATATIYNPTAWFLYRDASGLTELVAGSTTNPGNVDGPLGMSTARCPRSVGISGDRSFMYFLDDDLPFYSKDGDNLGIRVGTLLRRLSRCSLLSVGASLVRVKKA